MRLLSVVRLAVGISLLSGMVFAQAPVPAALQLATAQVQAAVDAGQAASTQTHQALATRQQMLLGVIRQNPEAARAFALPLATRQALLQADPTTAPLLEYEINKTGELTESVADSWTDGTSQTRWALHTATADLDLSLPAALLATVPVNHHLVTVRGLGLADVVAADRVVEASPEEAAGCTPARSTSATDPKSTAPATCSPLGQQRIAVLIVKFPAATPAFPTGLDQAAYWNQVLFGANPSVNTYWNEVSQGQTSATGDVYGPFQLSTQYDCTTTSAMQTAAIAAAAGTVDFSQYNRIIIVYPVTSCTFGGLGNIGCQSASATIAHQYSVVWLPISPNYRADFTYPQMWGGTSHELGHNLGLNHGNTLDFNAISLGPLDFSTTNPGTVVGSGSGSGSGSNLAAVNTEYGDNFDVMGYPWTYGGPYNAVHRTKILGWIPQTDERDITANGTFTLVPAENASGLRALHVLRDPSSTSWLWVEFHQSIGYYESANFSGHTSSGDTETTGAQIHYDTPFTNGSNPYTYLLDMTPVASQTTGNNNFYDGTLAPGKSWSDPYSLLTLTVGTQTSAGLNVTVSYDTPCATLALNSSAITAAGGAGTLTITAPSSCNWTVTSNATWITFPGATTGSGSAVIAFTAAANSSSLQRNTFLTAQRQSLGLVQPGTNITLTSIAPNQGSSIAGTSSPFTLAFSDAAGLNDVSQLNFDYTGLGTPDCQVSVVWNNSNPYLYLYSNGAFGSGLQVGAAGSLTSPSCNISGPASSFTVTGNSATLTLGLTFTTAFLGEHNITVNAYGKVANTAVVPLGVWTVTALQSLVSTTTRLTASPATTSSFGQSVVFTAAVSSGSGTVSFLDGSTSIGSAPVTNGTATLTTTALAVGSHSITAAYAGDSSDAASTSSALAYTVTQKTSAATTTTLTALPATAPYGTGINLNAVVSPAAATGYVAFVDTSNANAPVAQNVTLSNGLAATTTNPLSLGTHQLAANYSGDGNYTASNSALVTVTVTQAISSTRLTATPQPVSFGSSLTLAATVTSPGGTGSVTWMEGATTLGKVTLVQVGNTGTASLTMSTLSAGTHNVTAIYSGDTNVAGSTSAVVAVVVSQAASAIVLTPSATTVSVGAGLTLSAAVTPNAATGTVTFYSSGVAIGTGSLANGVATFAATTAVAGTFTYTAAYGGDTNDAPATSAGVAVTVTSVPTTTTTLAGTLSSIVPSATAMLAAHVIPSSGNSPTGNVTLFDGGAAIQTVGLSSGTANFPLSALSLGTHSFTAVYAGSPNAFVGSTSNVFPLLVAKLANSFAVVGSASTTFAGGSVTLTATPTAPAGAQPGAQTGGTVTFTDGSTTLGTVVIANGATASYTVSNLAAGTHQFGALYSGSIDLNGSTGSPFGVGVQDFALAVPVNSATITSGSSQAYPLTLTPGSAGFTSAIALVCSGAPAGATCSINPGSVTPGTGPATATLDVTTTAHPAPAAGWLLIALAPGLLALRRCNRRRLDGLLAICVAFAMLAAATGCSPGTFMDTGSGSGNGGTPAGTYMLTITGTATGATNLTHATTVSLTVK